MVIVTVLPTWLTFNDDDAKSANTKLEKKVNNKTNTNPIEIILLFIVITNIVC
jgi:hypothetical protein